MNNRDFKSLSPNRINLTINGLQERLKINLRNFRADSGVRRRNIQASPNNFYKKTMVYDLGAYSKTVKRNRFQSPCFRRDEGAREKAKKFVVKRKGKEELMNKLKKVKGKGLLNRNVLIRGFL